MDFIKKLQALPLKKRKLILWIIVIIIGIALLFIWSKKLEQRLKSFQGGDFIKELEFPES